MLHQAFPISKNDAEELEPGNRAKTRHFWHFLEEHREYAFAVGRETLPRVAALYAQTTKNQPNWFNMSRSRKHARTALGSTLFHTLG